MTQVDGAKGLERRQIDREQQHRGHADEEWRRRQAEQRNAANGEIGPAAAGRRCDDASGQSDHDRKDQRQGGQDQRHRKMRGDLRADRQPHHQRVAEIAVKRADQPDAVLDRQRLIEMQGAADVLGGFRVECHHGAGQHADDIAGDQMDDGKAHQRHAEQHRHGENDAPRGISEHRHLHSSPALAPIAARPAEDRRAASMARRGSPAASSTTSPIAARRHRA